MKHYEIICENGIFEIWTKGLKKYINCCRTRQQAETEAEKLDKLTEAYVKIGFIPEV